ncbi:hypothetical protein ACP70R_025552 [Stipagrostis hirtigluma subsp. patula]
MMSEAGLRAVRRRRHIDLEAPLEYNLALAASVLAEEELMEMPRRKVAMEQIGNPKKRKQAMELIKNPKKRQATHRNRRDGLVQKVSQLETLCGVECFLISYGPLGAGATVLARVARFRATLADRLQHVVDTATYLSDELAKQQRKLLMVSQCGAGERLDWDRSLDDLSAAGLNALDDTLEETLRRVQRRIVALGGNVALNDDDDDIVPACNAAAPTPLAVQPLPDNAFDFAYGLPDAGDFVTRYYYPPHYYDMSPCLGFQMPPPYLGFQFEMPPPAPLAPGYGMTGTETMDARTYATDGANGASTAAGLYGDLEPGFIAGGGQCVDDDAPEQGLAAAHAGSAGYDDPWNQMAAGVWPLTWLNHPMDGASFQQENGS